jgi:hypothetical protein
MTEIPKGSYDTPGPCWLPIVTSAGIACKPVIKCQCGALCGIGLHHVHADGRVTDSFYHSEAREWSHAGKTYSHEPGCGWHVHLKLLDYDQGDFPGVP